MRYNSAMQSPEKNVLFVCWGNICRSPAAEGLMKSLVAEHGLETRVGVDSAGTISYHAGQPPDPRMREAAARRGYELEGSSRLIRPEDVDRFDLIVAMDRSNLADLDEILGDRPDNVRLLSEFLPAGSPVEVPDPYFGAGRGFDVVLDMLEEACPRLLDQLLGDDPGAH